MSSTPTRNDEIEVFLKCKALDFARRKCSITYLVLDEETRLLGYFTLAHKNLYVNSEQLSQTRKRRLRTFAGPDDGAGLFNVSAFLIAQLGRNFAIPPETGIQGDVLLHMAMKKLQEAQGIVGGEDAGGTDGETRGNPQKGTDGSSQEKRPHLRGNTLLHQGLEWQPPCFECKNVWKFTFNYLHHLEIFSPNDVVFLILCINLRTMIYKRIIKQKDSHVSKNTS